MSKVAYVVGIDSYQISKLKGCVADAKKIAELLARNGDSKEKSEKGSENFDVTIFENIEDHVSLKKLILELFKKKVETLLFYFSGHGILSEDEVAYIATDASEEFNEGISMDYILRLANKSPSENKIIILDCCHSGSMGNIDGKASIAEGVTIMTSSRDNESSIEINGHGVFTNLLIEALKGGAADIRGNITMGEIYAFIDRALGPSKQRPVFKTNVTRFVPIRLVKEQVPPQYLRNLLKYFKTPNSKHKLNPSYEWSNFEGSKDRNYEPYAIDKKVVIFKELQAMVKFRLVVPDNKDDMYWEAMEGRIIKKKGVDVREGSCSLTPLGKHYWNLEKMRSLKKE